MDRRGFLSTTALGVAAGLAGAEATAQSADSSAAMSASSKFKLKYAPHFGMFENHAGKDLVDQIRFAADQGFTAWEDNGMIRRPTDVQEKIGNALRDLGMQMGVFVVFAVSDFSSEDMVTRTDRDYRDFLRKEMQNAVECGKRCGATWSTVVPGHVSQKLEYEYQMANCVDNLRVMADVYEPHGLVMVLESLNWWANHPGLFLRKIPQAYNICRAVDSPACKILDDLYHQQVTEGNLIPNMDKAWDEIAYIQVGDNPGRKEPTTGEINYRNIFQWLHRRGYQGVIGMEHGLSRKGKEGEQALLRAYRQCDDFSI